MEQIKLSYPLSPLMAPSHHDGEPKAQGGVPMKRQQPLIDARVYDWIQRDELFRLTERPRHPPSHPSSPTPKTLGSPIVFRPSTPTTASQSVDSTMGAHGQNPRMPWYDTRRFEPAMDDISVRTPGPATDADTPRTPAADAVDTAGQAPAPVTPPTRPHPGYAVPRLGPRNLPQAPVTPCKTRLSFPLPACRVRKTRRARNHKGQFVTKI